MDRKKFLQLTSTGAMAGMALSAFPKTLLAKTEPETAELFGWWSEPDNIEMFMKLYTEAFTNYDNLKNYREIELALRKVYFDEQGERDSYSQLYYARYELNEAPVLIDTDPSKRYSAVARRLVGDGDDSKLEVNEILSLKLNLRSDVISRIEVDTEFSNHSVRLVTPSKTECFLTSACTRVKGLPDDCVELETLRAFRDDYMATMPLGKELIQEYAVVGPAVVEQIDRQPNARQMYASIFDSLVLPSIVLIKEGRKEDAMHFYKKYVEGLNKILA